VNYNKNCYSVLNAYGIKGRAPASSEITFIRRWNEEYGFTLDIILEACDRTMNTIHQPSFEYTDTILKRWLDKGVRKFADIQSVDAEYLIERERKKKASANAAKQAAVQQGGKPNKFNNFDGREYNMNDLERQLVQQ
jgi:DnaD/phage-associated family protein